MTTEEFLQEYNALCDRAGMNLVSVFQISQRKSAVAESESESAEAESVKETEESTDNSTVGEEIVAEENSEAVS